MAAIINTSIGRLASAIYDIRVSRCPYRSTRQEVLRALPRLTHQKARRQRLRHTTLLTCWHPSPEVEDDEAYNKPNIVPWELDEHGTQEHQ